MFDNLGINVYVCIFFELNEIPNWKLKAHTNVYLSELDPLIAVIRERAIPGSTPGIYSQLIDKNAGLKMEKFNKAQAKNLAAAQKLVDTYASSSEDEGELDENHILGKSTDACDVSFENHQILCFIFSELLYKNYKPSDNAGSSKEAARTSTFLENTLHSGAATCLICIGSIRRVEAIWSCESCYCFFHLKCIQRWANDSMMQMKVKAAEQQNGQGHYNHLGEFVPPKRQKSLHWCCPQCRRDYQPADKPTQYNCFCGKEVNPENQPFLVPHSCGEHCGKLLQPKCGHDCKLLCHPGPCPPCAQQAQVSCLCGKSSPRSVRCIDKQWTCQQTVSLNVLRNFV